jgi:hypothetical protein
MNALAAPERAVDLSNSETRRVDRSFLEVGRLTRDQVVYRVKVSSEEYLLTVEDLRTGLLKIRTAHDWKHLLALLLDFEVDLLFVRQCLAFLSTWKMTARIGAEKEKTA